MLDKARSLMELVKAGLISFRDTDFGLVQYGSLGLALGAGLFLVLALVFKLLWGRNKFRRPYSGHAIDKKYWRGNTVKLICLFPQFLFGVAVFFFLVALANPYLPRTKIEERIESIEWIHLIDVSPSKGWPYENTKRSVAEVIHEAFMKFLEMRKGQNDRASLWYFAGAPTMVEDFITDDDVYMIQAEDMPYVVTDPGNALLPENDPKNYQLDIIAPRDRIKMVYNGSGTDLVSALNAVISYFANEGDKKIKQKVLLIETDMAIDANPDAQLKELKKRKINVYILHTKPNEDGERRANSGNKLLNAELFRRQIEQYGFKFYSVHDRRSLENAYRDVNKLEKSPAKVIRYLLRVFIYQRPLLFGVVLLFLAVGTGLITERFWGENP
ncbi:MAG: vWA domain-containing protein [Candidatus Taylorbacteria bacterium]|nr:vWA domain-containing protein [Candidatus Taylorbacteria bacterium]